MKKIMCFVLCSILFVPPVLAYAEDLPETEPVVSETSLPEEPVSEDPIFTEPASETETTEFTTTVTPTVISVTVPLSVDIYINPNEADGFMYGAIEVTNHTSAPVVVSIKEFRTDTLPFESCIRPENLPYGLNWDNLSVSETRKYFALGIRPITFNNRYWKRDLTSDYVYAVPGLTKTGLGIIDGNSSAYLGLRAYYGKAFREEAQFSFSATFVVELME